ncbi:MAG: hypothetical protein FWC95_08215 [Defluviitaleaceae bacterium]|nr:hypothetical protein [Defluviitaleaceae bacterium]
MKGLIKIKDAAAKYDIMARTLSYYDAYVKNKTKYFHINFRVIFHPRSLNLPI